MTDVSIGPDASEDDIAHWVRTNLPHLNAEALRGERSLTSLVEDLNGVMVALDSPCTCTLDECRRRLIVLGMIGSSAERHSQDAGNPPGHALSLLHVAGWPFRKYVATLASRAGGPPRDSLLSYVMWNAPTVDVYLPNARTPFLTLPSAFPDDGQAGLITFSDDPGERAAITLLKRCAALEAAANDQHVPGRLKSPTPHRVALTMSPTSFGTSFSAPKSPATTPTSICCLMFSTLRARPR